MQIGEEKKEGNQSQDLSARLQAVQSPILRRSKRQSPSPVQNRNTWLYFTRSRSKSGSSASSTNSATTSAIKTSSTATIKAPSYWPTTPNIMLARNTSTSSITSSGTALKMEGLVWSTVPRRTWWGTD